MKQYFKKDNMAIQTIAKYKKNLCGIIFLLFCLAPNKSVLAFNPLDYSIKYTPEEPKGIFHKGKDRMFPERTFIGDVGFSGGRISYNDKKTGALRREFRFAGFVHLTINLFEEVYFRTTFFKQFQDAENLPPWTSDYYYILERFNWRPNTFSYGYENYTPNKYKATSKQFREHLLQGRFYVSYGHNLSRKLINSLKIDNTTTWSVKYFVKYSINYQDELNNNYGEGKIASGKLLMGLSTRYVIWNNIYVEGGLYYFPERDKLVAWDPDYTYGFGYFDWRAFKVNFSYGNWVVNRFPWNEKELKYYGFLDGDFKLSFSYAW